MAQKNQGQALDYEDLLYLLESRPRWLNISEIKGNVSKNLNYFRGSLNLDSN